AGELVADTDLGGRFGVDELLRVGVHRDELDAEDLLLDHAVHGVAAATAHADDLDRWEAVEIGPCRLLHRSSPLLSRTRPTPRGTATLRAPAIRTRFARIVQDHASLCPSPSVRQSE